jgi:hypothetical protein
MPAITASIPGDDMTRRRKTAAAATASPEEEDTGESIRVAAAQYTADALAELARIMREGKTEPARIAAAKELLDRALPRRSAAGNDGVESVIEMIEELARERERHERERQHGSQAADREPRP